MRVLIRVLAGRARERNQRRSEERSDGEDDEGTSIEREKERGGIGKFLKYRGP